MISLSKTQPGSPLPLGVTTRSNGVNFAVYAKTETPVKLHLYSKDFQKTATHELYRTGHVYHIFVEETNAYLFYAYEVDGLEPLLDPYAKAISRGVEWGAEKKEPILGVISQPSSYDWEDDQPPIIPPRDLILYEMHVRGFTIHSSSRTQNPGTYKGMIEKIPYLKELGINAVELLPIFSFNESENRRINPLTNVPLYNYWGYSTLSFFTPMAPYATSPKIGDAENELKDLVKQLHKNGIEVILDVVYNHTNEGNEKGPFVSFKGLDNATYYILDEQARYLNFSGCGNTFNTNHPIVRELILDSLRYWVTEYHVDGFRFDLASILTRGTNGLPLKRPPLIEAITHDPILSRVKLIAEAWDAVGLYQVGSFYPSENRWNEWNGVYRDTIRRFIKGTYGLKGDFATRLSGSKDLYHRQEPWTSINFVTCHDGFTLADLVSFNQKHNLENGENNQDGTSSNDSWNCGVEGTTDNQQIIELRDRQMRNFVVALMVSQGTPMLHMGDEYGHTKKGNNNTWCQDNELSWFLWDKIEENASFFNFYKQLIAFRKTEPHFHSKDFIGENDIHWHSLKPNKPDWQDQSSFLAFTLLHEESHLYIAFNATDSTVTVELPKPRSSTAWATVVNTSQVDKETILKNDDESLILQDSNTQLIKMERYSCIILKS